MSQTRALENNTEHSMLAGVSAFYFENLIVSWTCRRVQWFFIYVISHFEDMTWRVA